MADEGGATGWLVAVVGAIGTAAGVIGGFLLKLFQEQRVAKKQDRIDALEEWRDLVAKLEQQVERSEAVVRQQQQAIEAIHTAHVECREESAELRSTVHFLYDMLSRHNDLLKQLGHDPGPMPQLPPPRLKTDPDFLVRQATQSASLVQAAGQVVKPPPTQ